MNMNWLRVICVIILAHTNIGSADASTYSVINGINNGTAFECNNSVVLRCSIAPNESVVQWQINNTIVPTTPIAAECTGLRCIVHNNFSSRYGFTYIKSTGIADLTINPVTFEDDQMNYLCDDLTLPSVFTATVKSFPKQNTTDISTSGIRITVRTACIANFGDLHFSWFKVKVEDNTTSPLEKGQETQHPCLSSQVCTGNAYSSVYVVNKTRLGITGEHYLIKCEVSVSDPDAPAPVILYSNETFVATEDSTYEVDVLSTGEIIAIVFGALAFVGLVGFCIFAVIRCRDHERVQVAPDTPKAFITKEVIDTSAEFWCTPGVYVNGQKITLNYVCLDGEKNNIEMKTTIDVAKGGQSITITATKLKPRHQYRCYVFAENSKGMKSVKSEDLDITTLGKPDPPTDLKEIEEERTSRSITVCWKPGQYGRKRQRFVVMYGLTKKMLDRVRWKEETLLDDPRREIVSYKIYGMKPGKKYVITVVAENDFGSTKLDSVPLKVTTLGTSENENRPSQDGAALYYHAQKEVITSSPSNVHSVL